MQRTTRRNLLKAAAIGSVTVTGLGAALGAEPQPDSSSEHAGHQNNGDHDRRKNHTVSFGNWTPSIASPLDRMGADPNPRSRNGHFLIPDPIRIHAGDTVSFVISGFHNLVVYGPDWQPSDIDRTILLTSPPGTFPPLVDDPNHRIYRGLDPRTNPANQDRVEAVAFNERGRFLVICAVLPHFFDSTSGDFVMVGYVDVDG
jgi:hypothetical protein